MNSFRRETDCRRPMFCSTTPRFIQVILDDTSSQVKPSFPKNFLDEYGHCLSNLVLGLKLPSGFVWEVEVTRNNGKVWFEKCWPEFSKFYRLAIGDFLVFEYKGNSEFHVFLFDRSTTEIDYPIKRPKTAEARLALRGVKSKHLSFVGRGHASNTNEKPTIQRNIASNSEKPSFKVVMWPSYIAKGFPSLPAGFSKKHLTDQPASVTLQVLDGRTWSVQVKYLCERSQARFQSRWSLFVRGNNLKAGDVCEFTLINCIEYLLLVVIYPATEAADCSLSPGHSGGEIHRVKSKESPRIEVESACDVAYGIGGSSSINETGYHHY